MIFCVMGKSASGKDYIYKKILEINELNLDGIVPYTTRPMREGEINGKDYNFISENEVNDFIERGLAIEERTYTTKRGVWRYLTVDDGQIGSGDNIIIGTPESCKKLQEYFGYRKVCPIYITVDDGERLLRAIKRERKQECPNYEEVCRRFIADEKDFAFEKLEDIGVRFSFENTDKKKIIEDVSAYIKEIQSELKQEFAEENIR